MEYMEFLIGEAEVTCRCLEDLDGMRPSLIGFCVTVAVLFIGVIAMIPVDFITDFTNEYRIAFMKAAYCYDDLINRAIMNYRNSDTEENETDEQDCQQEV